MIIFNVKNVDELERGLKADTASITERKRVDLQEFAAKVIGRAVDMAPVGKNVGGTLRRSRKMPSVVKDTSGIFAVEIGFNAPHAEFVHENISGEVIKPGATPGKKYLYIPLSKRAAKGWREGLVLATKDNYKKADYALPGFPGKPKPVNIPPQPRAKFLEKALNIELDQSQLL